MLKEDARTIYYDKVSGYVCNVPPYYIAQTDDSLSIEIDKGSYAKINGYLYGKVWAVIDGVLSLIEDKAVIETAKYKIQVYRDEIVDLQDFLSSTDYVAAKISEALLVEDSSELSKLKLQYAETLQQRVAARQRINYLNAQIEELEKEPE